MGRDENRTSTAFIPIPHTSSHEEQWLISVRTLVVRCRWGGVLYTDPQSHPHPAALIVNRCHCLYWVNTIICKTWSLNSIIAEDPQDRHQDWGSEGLLGTERSVNRILRPTFFTYHYNFSYLTWRIIEKRKKSSFSKEHTWKEKPELGDNKSLGSIARLTSHKHRKSPKQATFCIRRNFLWLLKSIYFW